MKKLQKIFNEPYYHSKASSFSKLIIAVFFISYVYMISTSSNNMSGIGLIVFLVAGLFISSILIAMPFFIIKRLLPKISIIVIIGSIIATFFITRLVFNRIFDQSNETTTTVVLPDKFSNDKEMFKESLIKYGEISDITNSSNRNASNKQTEKVLLLTMAIIEDSKKVSDEFLNFLHKDLRINYREKFLRSQQLYYEGLSQSSVKKQIEAVRLMNEWLNWWKSNDKEIIDKIF